ncbi:MAG: DNA recombination protein RmuC, partial [Methanomicrobia archaeon]|nr:DNA recombination protein RmuC [Methanomicrobia archaeon]
MISLIEFLRGHRDFIEMGGTSMTDLELILSIIGLTLLLALLILVIVLLSKKPKENPYQVEAIGALKGQIDRLQGDIAHDLADTLKEELAKIKDANALQSKENIEKMGQLENKLTKSLSDDVGKITEKVDAKFLEINTKIEEKIFQGFKTTTKTVEGVVEKLALLEQAQKNIQELSGQVVNLNNVLSNNQSRGKFGEFQLSSILHQVFGDTKGLYELQAELKVKGRETVRPDAQIHLPEPNHIVCIDAKFPFQSYQKIFDRQNNEDVSELKKQFSAEIIKH